MTSLLPSPLERSLREAEELELRTAAITVVLGRARYLATNPFPRPRLHVSIEKTMKLRDEVPLAAPVTRYTVLEDISIADEERPEFSRNEHEMV